MLSRLVRRTPARAERGQVIYLFALLAPIFLGLAAIVLSVGNWYVHKRHLQTQVDASVLAAAPTFSSCFFDPTVANAGIISDAVPYSGDTARAAAQSSTSYNQQLQTPSHTHVIYNSGSRYWQQSDGTDPTKGGTDATKSYGGLDNSAGAPCMVSYLQAHATDDRAPLLFPWFIAHPSPKSTARVDIKQVRSENGFLPLAVPEIDPAYVYAIFTDYALDGTQVPIATQQLLTDPTNAACPPGGPTFPYACWITSAGQTSVTIHPNNTNSDGTGVVILVSKNAGSPPSMSGSLNQICNQAPNIVQCYAGTGSNYDGSRTAQGLSFIHSYRTANGTLAAPLLRDVTLSGTTCTGGTSPGDLSSPYFTNDDNDCSATVTAVVDFGSSWLGGNPGNDPTAKPNQGGICAEVDGLTWDSTDAATGYTTWKGPLSLSIPSAGGPQTVSLNWKDKASGNNCSSQASGGFPAPAAVAYSADDAAGPVGYVKLTATGPNCPGGGTVGDANSVGRGTYCYSVAVGLQQPITLKPWDSSDILLRFASKSARKGGSGTANLNGSLLCDHGKTLADTFSGGCQTFYGLNYDVWGTPTCAANGVQCWKDITCSSYSPSDLPPPSTVNNPLPICIAAKNGQVQAFQAGIYNRFEDPARNPPTGCTPNYWPRTQDEADQFFKPVSQGGHDFTKDPRYITLIVTDNTAFSSPNGAEPVKYFAGFYATGWDTGNGAGKPKGCYNEPGGTAGTCGAPNNDAHPTLGCLAGRVTSSDNGDVWGHFVKIVVFSGTATPGPNVCNLLSPSPQTCVAVLTR